MKTQWILCPVCGNKTRDRLREDTEIKNYPLYCHAFLTACWWHNQSLILHLVFC